MCDTVQHQSAERTAQVCRRPDISLQERPFAQRKFGGLRQELPLADRYLPDIQQVDAEPIVPVNLPSGASRSFRSDRVLGTNVVASAVGILTLAVLNRAVSGSVA